MLIERELVNIEAAKNGFTRNQKKWIRQAYETVLGSVFCVFPVWNGEEFVYCKSEQVEIHHIKPRGWCIRVLSIDPNVPGNGAPICPAHHRIGQRGRPLTRKDQDVIHLDAAYAQRNYRPDQRPTTYDRMKDQRFRLCGKNVPYWYELWDQYLTELAEDITGEFVRRVPHHKWPERRG